MKANDIQVGGGHYKDRAIQHWDVVDDNGIGYLEAVATKYLVRWRNKNGMEDLKKAEHYAMKLLENIDEKNRRPRGCVDSEQMSALKKAYDLSPLDYAPTYLLLNWSERAHVEAALKDIRDLIMGHEAVMEKMRPNIEGSHWSPEPPEAS